MTFGRKLTAYHRLGRPLARRALCHARFEAASPPNKRRAPDDKRFLDKAWREDCVLRLTRDLYQLNAAWILEQVRAAHKLNRHERRKLEFYTPQLLSALSPSNFAVINPRIRARHRNGRGSMIRGLELLVHDLDRPKLLLDKMV